LQPEISVRASSIDFTEYDIGRADNRRHIGEHVPAREEIHGLQMPVGRRANLALVRPQEKKLRYGELACLLGIDQQVRKIEKSKKSRTTGAFGSKNRRLSNFFAKTGRRSMPQNQRNGACRAPPAEAASVT
jgi:hypothetical protein